MRRMQAYMAEHIFTLTTCVSSKTRLGLVWQWQLAASYSSTSSLLFSSVFLPYSLKHTVAHYCIHSPNFTCYYLYSIFPGVCGTICPQHSKCAIIKPKSFQVNSSTITTACENAHFLHFSRLITKLTVTYQTKAVICKITLNCHYLLKTVNGYREQFSQTTASC